VGGHYASGEDATIAGPREIREELGLEIRFEELVPLGRRVFVHCFTTGVKEFEFQDVFLLYRDIHPYALVLQKEEVAGVIEMDVEEGIELFSGRRDVLESRLYGQGSVGEAVPVRAEDFVPCLDNYYLKMLLLAQRYLRGERDVLLI
jgi:8-oxo-dGTP pyrophosphatase MutT (NUDIX family)